MVILFFNWMLIVQSVLFTYTIKSIPESLENVHPFYVSVTEINHNNIDKNLEIACKIFTDDFESTLNTKYNARVDLFNTKDNDRPVVGKMMLNYISKHLVINMDGKPVKLEFVGFERESEAIWSYYQVSGVNPPKTLDISISLLYDSFAEQINLLHVTVNGKRKSTKLNNPQAEASFKF